MSIELKNLVLVSRRYLGTDQLWIHLEERMDRPQHIWFVRHGEFLGNVTARDVRAKLETFTTQYPLTERGLAQVRAACEWMQTHVPSPDALLASDFIRAQQTADALGYGPEIYREEHAMLGEQDFGLWYFHTEEEMLERFPADVRRRDLMKAGIIRSYHWRPVAGESGRDLESKAWALWGDLCQRFAGASVVLVGHGTWATVFMKLVLRWTTRQYEERFRIWHPKNAAILHFRAEGRSPRHLMAYDPTNDCVIPYPLTDIRESSDESV